MLAGDRQKLPVLKRHQVPDLFAICQLTEYYAIRPNSYQRDYVTAPQPFAVCYSNE
jgi:hypothetical protein